VDDDVKDVTMDMGNSLLPLNDLKRIDAEQARELERATVEVLNSGYWLNGPRCKDFCEAFSRYIDVAYCVGVGNGTDALEIALRTVMTDYKNRYRSAMRNEVVTVANAGGYTSTACFSVGLVPVYIDIEWGSQLADIESLSAAINERTLAVVATHLYGGVVDVPAIRELLKSRDLDHVVIIEDCAQAHGAMCRGRRVGSFGDIATFSFYPTKNLGAAGDGGLIASHRMDFETTIRALHQYGWSKKYTISYSGGRNSRLDELQAAILHAKLPRLDAANARRREILDAYASACPDGITMVESPLGGVAHLAVLLAEDRDRLRRHLDAQSIAADIHYPVLDCDQAGWMDEKYRVVGGLEVSRASVERILTLPCFPTMTADEVARVCRALQAYKP
jgi:aminotransferase EvaB